MSFSARIVEARHDESIPILMSPRYLASESRRSAWMAGFDGERLVCAAPVLFLRRLSIEFTRFVGGVHYFDEAYRTREQEFLELSVQALKQAGMAFIMQSSTSAVFDATPQGAEAIRFGTYTLDLDQEEAALWKGVHSKHRNSILSAERRGCVVAPISVDGLKPCYDLIADSFSRTGGRFVPWEKYLGQCVSLGENQRSMGVFAADGTMQGCATIAFTQHTAYYLHGGSCREPVSGAMNLLHWRLILLFKASGVRHYDFVGARAQPAPGSRYDGIKRFKARFGGRYHEGFMWRYAISPARYALFSLAFRALVSRQGDIIDQERATALNSER